MPDKDGVDGSLGNSTNPMWYTNGDGSQVRVWAEDRGVKVKLGSCTATISNFMFDGHGGVVTPSTPEDSANTDYTGGKVGSYWQHLVIAYNGQNSIQLYQNGELAQSQTCDPNQDFRSVDGFTVGYSTLTNITSPTERDIAFGPSGFTGYIDELRFYNRSLSIDEARDLYLNSLVIFNLTGAPARPSLKMTHQVTFPVVVPGQPAPKAVCPALTTRRSALTAAIMSNCRTTPPPSDSQTAASPLWAGSKVTAECWGHRKMATTDGYLPACPAVSRKSTGVAPAERLHPTALSSSQWNHVAFRYNQINDSGTFLGEVTIFVNGAEVAKQTNNLPFAGTGVVRLGQTEAEDFTGMLDNIVISGYALTQDEIKEYMNQAPVLNLHLDEGLENVLQSITSYSDDGPSGLTATCTGAACPVAGSRGQIREAPVFDGDDLLTIPDNNALDLETFSVGLWVKPQQIKNDFQPLLVKEASNGTARNYGLFIKPDTLQVHYSLQQSNCSTSVSGDSIGTLFQNQWNHVMMTFDGTVSKIYINGTLQGSQSYNGTPCQNNHPVKIGNEVSAYTGFEGALDEITLHNTALSAVEISDLFGYQSSWYDTTVHDQLFIDAEPPQVDLGESPEILAQQEVMLRLSAFDADSGVASVVVEITDPQNNVTSPSVISSTDLNSGNWFYTFSPNQSGRYTVKATATDNLGYVKTATKYVDVDNSAPYKTAVSGNYDAENEQLNVNVRVTDVGGYQPKSGVATETITLDVRRSISDTSISGPIQVSPPPNTPETNFWSAAYPFSDIPYGQFNVYGTAADKVGNSDSGLIGTIEIDAVAPIADVTLGTDILGKSAPPAIQGTATDVGYGLTGQQTILHFEEAAGDTKFIDSSPAQVVATCTITGCPTAGQSGKLGRAASFDGVADLLSLGTTPGHIRVTALCCIGLGEDQQQW
jgi:hypothetical protein